VRTTPKFRRLQLRSTMLNVARIWYSHVHMNKFATLVIISLLSCVACFAQQPSNKTYKAPELSAAARAEIAKATRAIEKSPSAANYCERGRIYGKNKHYAEAVPDHAQAIHLQPTNAFYWLSRGSDYSGLEQWDRGITDANKAISLSKTGDLVYVNSLRLRGHCYFKSGRQKLADVDYDALKAVGAAP